MSFVETIAIRTVDEVAVDLGLCVFIPLSNARLILDRANLEYRYLFWQRCATRLQGIRNGEKGYQPHDDEEEFGKD